LFEVTKTIGHALVQSLIYLLALIEKKVLWQKYWVKISYLENCKKPHIILDKLILTCLLWLVSHFWPITSISDTMDCLINQIKIVCLENILKNEIIVVVGRKR
jgi:hypothetical protein